MDTYSKFFQEGPELTNTFEADRLLQSYLRKKIPQSLQNEIFAHLKSVGEKAAGEWLVWARQAEENKPKLIQFDEWGKRIDEIIIHDGWKKIEAAAAEEGIVATAYERRYGEDSRVYQMSLLYLYHSSSAFFSCPLAMTDGAARAIELHAEQDLKQTAFKNLTSRDPEKFWTAGQWMTERTGGSDVSGTGTTAKHQQGSKYKLYGTKWFTSATKSQMAMTLAKIEGQPEKGLSLFYLEKNNLEVHRLKEKLGTDALPTAELSLNGTDAVLLGAPGEGVKRIASILNITRIYNSICAISHMRRALDLAWSYSKKRKAFGAMLIDQPLHKKTLLDMEKDFADSFRLTFYVVELLGKEEVGTASEDERKLLRALTPIVKLYTAKKCMAVVSEAVECFGGAGYVENTGIPRLLRDAQVFSIWEGTTNVLSLDFLRACQKENALSVLARFFDFKDFNQEKLADVSLAREAAFEVASRVIRGLKA